MVNNFSQWNARWLVFKQISSAVNEGLMITDVIADVQIAKK